MKVIMPHIMLCVCGGGGKIVMARTIIQLIQSSPFIASLQMARGCWRPIRPWANKGRNIWKHGVIRTGITTLGTCQCMRTCFNIVHVLTVNNGCCQVYGKHLFTRKGQEDLLQFYLHLLQEKVSLLDTLTVNSWMVDGLGCSQAVNGKTET